MRLTVSLAASYNWPLLDLDVRSAFLNGDLKETMYMQVLDNFCDSTTGTKVCCLKNSLFGLKQAPRVWFEKINTFFSIHGFSSTEFDYNLYYLWDSGEVILLILYVDNLLLTGSDRNKISQIKTQLMQKFKMTDLEKNQLLPGSGICIPNAWHPPIPKGLRIANPERIRNGGMCSIFNTHGRGTSSG